MEQDISSETVNGVKRLKTSGCEIEGFFNKKYFEEDFMKQISNAYFKRKAVHLDNNAYTLNDPFFCCVMNDFIHPPEYITSLKNEVESLEMKNKLNDLYQFKQSAELGHCEKLFISNFVKLIYGDLLKWMQEITNLPLTDKVDVSSSCYSYTDHLLCHDDQLEDRRIAFIYYLTPPWSLEDGGTLDLIESVNGKPRDVKVSIVPELNKFIFFEVSQISYHQVAEVRTDKERLAISGWFHGPPLPLSMCHTEILPFKQPSSTVDITTWINPTYLYATTQLEIRECFEESSEVELTDFFKSDKYQEVCKAFQDSKLKWERRGLCHQKHCLTLNDNESSCPSVIRECQELFCSEGFFLLLSNLTGLKLHPACSEESDVNLGKVCTSIRKWEHKCYTLLHDEMWNQKDALHALMYFNSSRWDSNCGGYTSYVSEGDEEELLRIEPRVNSLALVFITEGTASFVKYVNAKAKEKYFNDIFCVYIEDK